MKILIVRFACAVALLGLVMGLPAMAGDNEYGRASLKGVEAVYVLVESFSEDEKSAGFDTRTFQTDVELKLRLAGIKVLTKKEWLTTTGGPYLYLNVNPLNPITGENSPFNIDLEFNQSVLLDRDPSISVLAATWSVGNIGNGDITYVRDSVKDRVDTFINAWLSVNQ